MTMTRLRRRRLASAVAAVAAFSALSACGSDTTTAAAPSASATPTPGTLAGFCSTIVAIDTASSQLGGGGEESEDPAAAPSADAGAAPTGEPSGDPSPEASPAFSASSMTATDGDLPDPGPSAAAGYGTSDAVAATSSPEAEASAEPSDQPSDAPSGAPSEEGGWKVSGEELTQANELFNPLIAELERHSQPEVATEVDTMLRIAREALSTGDFGLFDSPDMLTADTKVDSFMTEKCGYGSMKITGSDFEFAGIPSTVKAGPTGVTLTNEGEEMHVAVLLRFNDGVTTSVEDLLKLPEAEAMKVATVAGESFAMPGRSETSFFDLKPGRYAAICPIPEGSKDGQEGDGAPHFVEGMYDDFTVE